MFGKVTARGAHRVAMLGALAGRAGCEALGHLDQEEPASG